jgi:type IV secretory pathway VirB10-like protein
MGEPLEVPSPPRPKRLNRLALVAVLVLLGVAVAAVFLTLAPAKRAKVAAEPPEGNGPPRPGFLEREPVGAPPAARRPAPAEAPSYWQEAMREGQAPGGGTGAGDDGGAGGAGSAGSAAGVGGAGGAGGWQPAAAGIEAGGAPQAGVAAGGERARTPAPSARAEAYRRALQAPVTPGHVGGEAAEGSGEGAGVGTGERVGERMARQLGLSGVGMPGAPPVAPAALLATGGAGGQLQEGGGVAAAAPPAGGAGAPARDHQGFLRSAEALAPAELRVRRDRAGAGLSVAAGTVIPAALVTAVESDVAGPLVAQVTQDVFDREQREVVIPRGSRLIGAYDSQVAVGERRLLVAWSRLIYPDGGGLSFPGLPAATRAGEAGLAGSVDNHLARVFGGAILLSILSAGVQLSQPQESATFGSAASTRQVAAAAVGQELSSVAIEMLRRQLSVPPTIRIAAGTRFLVFLRGDVSFEAAAQE